MTDIRKSPEQRMWDQLLATSLTVIGEAAVIVLLAWMAFPWWAAVMMTLGALCFVVGAIVGLREWR